MAWNVGDRLSHRFNPDLGPGMVQAVEGRTLVVLFPESGTELRLAAGSDALEPLRLDAGSRARFAHAEEIVTIEGRTAAGRVRLADGREVAEDELWPVAERGSLGERLARGDVDSFDAFALRLAALSLASIREAGGLGSFLGGRIRLFPHQLHAAERATRTDPVRWLLADEVGLGKTVEACLILNHLVRTGRADRVLIVAPDTLTVQWLGELWRKYHQVGVLLDEQRLADVERVYGRGFNPFDAHRRTVVGLAFLRDRPWLVERAVDAGIDLLIVDEAHHLRRPPGHPGDAAYRAIQPITALGRHVLLLTATPLEQDAHGFFRLLQLLRPEELPEELTFEERLLEGRRLPPCTSATRRSDIGGLPPRRPRPVTAPGSAGWAALVARVEAEQRRPVPHAVARQAQLRRIELALASGAALGPLLDADDPSRQLAREADARDPRIAWLVREAPGWSEAGDKTLVFVAHRETLEMIRTQLSRLAQLRTGVFHEDLSAEQRDIEVARFRLGRGPSLLVSTECGGEGRNFEFCTRLVLFDLPWSPMTVEQRIGRLDRIGRRQPVEIVYFKPPTGVGAAVAELYESLGLFRRPLGGLERELGGVQAAIEEHALTGRPAAAVFEGIVDRARAACDRIEQAALHELHREPYRPELAAEILARVPDTLEELTREVVLAAAAELELHVEEHRDGARHSIELVPTSRVDNLPGVAAGSRFLGTFDREEAVADESIDFFAAGHPLVEGLLAQLEDSPDGRVALLHARSPGGAGGFGLLALYRSGPAVEAVALDAAGRERPEWAARLTRRPLVSRRVKPESWTADPEWAERIRDLAARLEQRGRPVALAAFRLDPAGES